MTSLWSIDASRILASSTVVMDIAALNDAKTDL
jgi:hypothetical protein